MVSEGGVLYLVHGLAHPDLEVSCCCSEMLARLASAHQQQFLSAIRYAAPADKQGRLQGCALRSEFCACRPANLPFFLCPEVFAGPYFNPSCAPEHIRCLQPIHLFCCACRSAGGVSASVELLSRSPSSAQQLHLLSLISALARSSEDAGAELAQARTPAVLLQMVAVEPLPRTQVCNVSSMGPFKHPGGLAWLSQILLCALVQSCVCGVGKLHVAC